MESVRSSPTLERLNLSANAAGEGTASAVVALLRLNQTVTELDLSCNQYGQEACTSIRKALEQNTSVRVSRAGEAGCHAAYPGAYRVQGCTRTGPRGCGIERSGCASVRIGATGMGGSVLIGVCANGPTCSVGEYRYCA